MVPKPFKRCSVHQPEPPGLQDEFPGVDQLGPFVRRIHRQSWPFYRWPHSIVWLIIGSAECVDQGAKTHFRCSRSPVGPGRLRNSPISGSSRAAAAVGRELKPGPPRRGQLLLDYLRSHALGLGRKDLIDPWGG